MGEYATQRNSGTFYTSVLKTREPESLKLDGCGEFGAELDGCGRFVGRARQMRRGFGHLGGEKGCSGYQVNLSGGNRSVPV